MLKKQSAYDPMDFLAGDGEMARRTRTHDWKNHPFGLPETWPQSLRSALSICLNSAFPTAIYWGPELRLLYNDAWAPIPGPRHPHALGARAEDVWQDIWHIIQPQFAELVWSGTGLFVEDQMLPMRRFGLEEETYWNYSFTPLRAEDGRIVGIFNSGSETTDKVMQRRNSEFLISLNQELRNCDKTDEAVDLALSRLGQLLNASRVGICERTTLNGKPACSITSEWFDDGVIPTHDRTDASLFIEEQLSDLMSGKIVQASLSDQNISADSHQPQENAGISGLLAVPWTENGQVVLILYMHSRSPRAYNTPHVSTVEKVLETTMGWIDRERSREREMVMAAEIDHRARNMLAVIQSITRMTKGKDAEDIKAKLSDRFAALSRVNSLLGRKHWSNLEFREILEDELAPLGDEIRDRVRLSGPRLILSPQEAQPFAMILHELTTNALKYGSLRQDTGILSVTWSVDANRDMTLEWVETGVSPTENSAFVSTGSGFGSTLLSNVIQTQLGGQLKKTIKEDGIAYTFLLRLHRQENAAEHEASFELDIKKPAQAARSVMIVEDDAIISLDLADLVASQGYDVFGQFGSIETALESLCKGAPDVALLDADLGGRSSAPVAETLNAQSVPFIVVSGHGDTFADGDPRKNAPRIEKPISNAKLMSLIEQATEQS